MNSSNNMYYGYAAKCFASLKFEFRSLQNSQHSENFKSLPAQSKAAGTSIIYLLHNETDTHKPLHSLGQSHTHTPTCVSVCAFTSIVSHVCDSYLNVNIGVLWPA